MWLALLALAVGLFLGFWFIPAGIITPRMPNYLGLAILAAMDATLGAWRANLERSYEAAIFASGFFFNMLVAALLAYIGDLLGVDLALAAVVAFGSRIFNNLAVIRRLLLQRWQRKIPQVG